MRSVAQSNRRRPAINWGMISALVAVVTLVGSSLITGVPLPIKIGGNSGGTGRPSLATTPSHGGLLGPTKITDTGSLKGAYGSPSPGDTVLFSLYGPFTTAPSPASCTSAVFHESDSWKGGTAGQGNQTWGAETQTPYTPVAAGYYAWIATPDFRGDSSNVVPSADNCGEEVVQITAVPAPPTPTPTQLFSGSITLPEGAGRNLGILPSPNAAPYDVFFEYSFTVSNSFQFGGQGFSMLAPWTSEAAPQAADCQRQVATMSQPYIPAHVGTGICVQTASGNIAFLKLTAINTSGPSPLATADVVVWTAS